MILSNRDNWQYNNLNLTLDEIIKFSKSNSWIQHILNLVPTYELDYLELGCSPGICSAAISKNTDWNIFGVDYTNSEKVFKETLSLVGKKVEFYEADIFDIKLEKTFDIVASYGLIEHFSGSYLDQLFSRHDNFLKTGGYLIIELPNFTGFQYVWHYFFDKKSLNIHNVDIMCPNKIAKILNTLGYEILFSDYVGPLQVWGASGFNGTKAFIIKLLAFSLNKFSLLLEWIGIPIFGEGFSPHILVVARK